MPNLSTLLSLTFFFILFTVQSAGAKFQMTQATGSRRHIPKVSIQEIQVLDSQIQALNLPLAPALNLPLAPALDAEAALAPRVRCALDPKSRDSMLQSKRQILDQKIADFVAPKIHQQGSISIADGSWPQMCAKSCHCAVYKSILEAAGSERLSDGDRKIYQKLTELAMNQPLSERASCASGALSEICHASHK